MCAVPSAPGTARRASMADYVKLRGPGEADRLRMSFMLTILADVEVIPASHVNDAWAAVLKRQARYRFVLDLQA